MAWRHPKLLGRITYDAVFPSDDPAKHWFGLGMDRTKRLRFSYAVSPDGDWNATADIALGHHAIGGGRRDPEDGARRDFVAWEWSGPSRRAPKLRGAGIGR